MSVSALTDLDREGGRAVRILSGGGDVRTQSANGDTREAKGVRHSDGRVASGDDDRERLDDDGLRSDKSSWAVRYPRVDVRTIVAPVDRTTGSRQAHRRSHDLRSRDLDTLRHAVDVTVTGAEPVPSICNFVPPVNGPGQSGPHLRPVHWRHEVHDDGPGQRPGDGQLTESPQVSSSLGSQIVGISGGLAVAGCFGPTGRQS